MKEKSVELTFNDLPSTVSFMKEELSEIKQFLFEKFQGPQLEEDKLLTIKEAGAYLNLSVPTLYAFVQRSEIPVSKKGKRLYFTKQQLSEWVQAGRKKTKTEIASESHQYLKKKGNKA